MAAGATPVEALLPVLTLLGFGAASALGAKALRLSPIVGYLITGTLIGPHVLGFMHESDATHLMAELGVVFLLFDIGLHVSMRDLQQDQRSLLRLAPLHLALTGSASAIALFLIGIDWPIAIAVGLSLALSSTAVVARILTEREQTSCPLGRGATHVLIFQDIVAIFLMIYATSLGSDAKSAQGAAKLASDAFYAGGPVPLWVSLGLAFLQTGLAFAAAIIAGRTLINPVFRLATSTRNAEAFTAFTLLLVLAAACATAWLGLSLTLGAFLAGLAISGTPYRHEVQTEMSPFRGLLLSFFFINVGLLLDVPKLIQNLPLVVLTAFALLVMKSGLGFIAARVTGWSTPGATQMGTLLAQGSEFTLVILSLASILAGVPAGILSVLVASVALSLALAPLWAGLGSRLARRLAETRRTSATSETASTERRVVIIGLTPAGRLAIDALIAHDLPYAATEYDPERFLAAVSDGYDVSFGDTTNMKLVEAVGGPNVRAVVLGLSRIDVSRAITPQVQRRFPDILRFAAVETREDVAAYAEIGVHAHLTAAEPHGIEMVADLLMRLGTPPADVRDWMAAATEQTRLGEVTADEIAADETVTEAA